MSAPVDPQDAVPAGLLDKILVELKHSVRREHFETWFRDVTLRRIEGERYVFGVTNSFVRDWIRKNYLAMIESAVRAATGRRRCEVVLQLGRAEDLDAAASADVFARVDADVGSHGPVGDRLDAADGVGDDLELGEILEGDRSATAVDADVGGGRGASSFQPIPSSPADSRGFDGRGLDARGLDARGLDARGPDARGFEPRGRFDRRDTQRSGSEWDRLADMGELNRNYTFDQFVVGPCNRLSHAAALAVAEHPGRAYNPLFIHGNVGLGKTHLLQAICHETRRKSERARVLYLSCEEFTNRFIHAIQVGRLDEFREFHRSVDVLVVDDVQFLANKEKTQDEFFHTFNALYNSNRQIIISSDRSPSDIPTIEERLVSRFRWGLVAEMEVPCFETRVAIVRRKAKLRQLELPEDVAYFIAERIDTNIRELEGAVVKVVGVASITDREVSVELAEEALRGVVVQRSRQISVSEIMGMVTGEFSISARDLTGKSRTQQVSLPRQICMYLCRQHTDQSLEEIGKYFGGRDHTTVLYAVKKIEKRVKDDRMFRELLTSLSTRLTN